MRFCKWTNIYFLTAVISCNSPKRNNDKIENDTTRILKLAIQNAFHPTASHTTGVIPNLYKIKDSIPFASDSALLKWLPVKIDSILFMIIPRSKMKSLILSDSNLSDPPSYLDLTAFQKNDSGYYVRLTSFSRIGFRGGSIGMIICKQGDSFYVREKLFRFI